jgi:hypothetical protein
MQDAKSHVLLIEGQLKLHPDRAIFQSWNPYPTHVLPETAPDTLTHLVDFYIKSWREKMNELGSRIHPKASHRRQIASFFNLTSPTRFGAKYG